MNTTGDDTVSFIPTIGAGSSLAAEPVYIYQKYAGY
jgi:hypothetical protein